MRRVAPSLGKEVVIGSSSLVLWGSIDCSDFCFSGRL